MTTIIILLCIGLVAGMLSGMVGIGGGIVIVPALVFFIGYSQHQAQGTALFMFLFPIGILGVLNYYQQGYVEWKTAFVIASTFVIGSYFASMYAVNLNEAVLKRVFAVFLIIYGVKLLVGK